MQKIAFLMLMLIASSFAADFVAVNSYDGRDVLSAIFYANVLDVPVKFFPPGGDPELFGAKVGSGHDILLIQGANPVSGFVETELTSRNNTVEVYKSQDAGATNLDLAKRSGAKSFIIVDSAFADSAISVIPYADLTNSFVLLSNSENADEVSSVVQGAEKVTLYGFIDESVRGALSGMKPDVIGKGEDKFEDNLLIVDKTLREFNTTRVLFVDGSVIEDSMVSSQSPIILIGKLIPDQTYDFVKRKVRSGEIQSSLLVKQEQVAPVYDMKKQIESELLDENKTLSVVVKFAQVIPSESSGVMVLDMFPMPVYRPLLELNDIIYEKGNILASIDNIGEGPAFYTYEIKVLVDGFDQETFSSNEISLIERGEQDVLSLSFDIDSVPSGNITYTALVKYGSSVKSLEEFVSNKGPLATVDFDDKSSVAVQSAKYEDGAMLVTIKNNATVTAYVFPRLKISLDGEPVTVAATDTRQIEPGSLIVEQFPLELSSADITDNKNVTVEIEYGARPGFLIKKSAFVVSLEKEEPQLCNSAAMILLVALGGLFMSRRI